MFREMRTQVMYHSRKGVLNDSPQFTRILFIFPGTNSVLDRGYAISWDLAPSKKNTGVGMINLCYFKPMRL